MVLLPLEPWPTGTAVRCGPLVRQVLAANASPYTYTGTQSFVVGDGRQVAVIDPGPADPAHVEALLKAIGEATLSAILVTHTHRDHSPAALPLAAATGAPVMGCAPLAPAGDAERADAPFDATYAPDAVMAEGDSVAGDGWTLTALATPGHTSNHLCFALREAEALFTGDHVMGWSTSVVAPPDGDMGDYVNSLERLVGREERVYYPAHGEAVHKPQQLVRGMIGHRRQRERQIVRLLAQEPRSAAALVQPMYKGLDERLKPAAEMSVMAHLIDLERRGVAARDGLSWHLR
ncbi:MBL fold metallo-hydrolase [Erythrobacteraceae bacterium CFH 75059]|uniref:MBL fold metallo-hydrolase n=1 Tax=Qipengyuania thermophila TaxID=2509361 RepID=UPI00101FD394|nr:MBL fold metallo-hydrolase [Qipengyuania thermophila]TCD04141.1 MBL fold metallo-hydrolase [Erythrobacteraceae bacterium CFH 75059]